jgi:hypothetical protein
MISKTEKLKYKAILGHRYVAKITVVLNETNETDTSGKPYSSGMIRQVFNGFSENIVVESAIIEAVKRQKKYLADYEKKKSTILK